jgi:hypothetical protein
MLAGAMLFHIAIHPSNLLWFSKIFLFLELYLCTQPPHIVRTYALVPDADVNVTKI